MVEPQFNDPAWTTSGPWRVNKYGSIGAGEFGTQPIVANVEGLWGSDAEKYGDHCANARLIAAAPRMYAALKAAEGHLLEVLKDPRWHPIGDCPVLRMVQDALAQAGGVKGAQHV